MSIWPVIEPRFISGTNSNYVFLNLKSNNNLSILNVYDCKNKQYFPIIQTFSGKYANLGLSFNRCVIRLVPNHRKLYQLVKKTYTYTAYTDPEYQWVTDPLAYTDTYTDTQHLPSPIIHLTSINGPLAKITHWVNSASGLLMKITQWVTSKFSRELKKKWLHRKICWKIFQCRCQCSLQCRVPGS